MTVSFKNIYITYVTKKKKVIQICIRQKNNNNNIYVIDWQ